MAIVGATSEVVTLKQALLEAEKRAASERTEREKYEAEVGKVRQELQALMEKHESLELDSKTRASKLTVAIKNAKSAKAEFFLASSSACLRVATSDVAPTIATIILLFFAIAPLYIYIYIFKNMVFLTFIVLELLLGTPELLLGPLEVLL